MYTCMRCIHLSTLCIIRCGSYTHMVCIIDAPISMQNIPSRSRRRQFPLLGKHLLPPHLPVLHLPDQNYLNDAINHCWGPDIWSRHYLLTQSCYSSYALSDLLFWFHDGWERVVLLTSRLISCHLWDLCKVPHIRLNDCQGWKNYYSCICMKQINKNTIR